MRKSVAVYLTIPALIITGCGKGKEPDPTSPAALKESLVPPAVPSGVQPREAVVHDAERGAVRIGDATVTIKGAAWTLLKDKIPTVTIFVGIKIQDDAPPAILNGWAYDKDLISNLTGLPVEFTSGPTPLPINFSATTDNSERLRGIMRSVQDDTPGSPDTEVSTREIRAVPGKSYGWVLTFERPGPKAKELRIELDAADLGGTGRIRFVIPSRAEWKPKT